VVRLVSEGLGNKDIATRPFVSPRTVQTHLTHAYTKLGLSSRVQLVQEAARHASPKEVHATAAIDPSRRAAA
jgi:DNA-binding CsgD family transcriptional regulator